jgi:hypothetical protein
MNSLVRLVFLLPFCAAACVQGNNQPVGQDNVRHCGEGAARSTVPALDGAWRHTHDAVVVAAHRDLPSVGGAARRHARTRG